MPVTASIEIAAPPSTVRAKFLDFPSLPTYHTTFFKSIVPLSPTDPLSPTQKLRVDFGGMKMDAVILANSPHLFKWGGSLPLIFGGNHSFEFKESKVTPGGTTFTQHEEFYGALGFLMGGNFVGRWAGFGRKTEGNWDGFNRDLKGVCEKEVEGGNGAVR